MVDRYVRYKFISMKSSKLRNGVMIPLLAIIAALSIAVFALVKSGVLTVNFSPETALTPSGGTSQTKPAPTMGPTATPTMSPLPQGLGVYDVSQGSAATGPYVSKIILDTHDPKVGETFRVRVTSSKRNAAVSRVVVTEKNDRTSTEKPLSLVSGDADKGEWEASWTITEPHLYTFSVITTAYGADGTKTEVDMVFRKP